jgi:hypothetical protein
MRATRSEIVGKSSEPGRNGYPGRHAQRIPAHPTLPIGNQRGSPPLEATLQQWSGQVLRNPCRVEVKGEERASNMLKIEVGEID